MPAATTTRKTESRGRPKRPRKRRLKTEVSRTKKPDNMTLEQWQISLRVQFGRQQRFKVENLGDAQVFSVFAVTNQETRRTYRVTVRGGSVGDNHCTCSDYTINTLGTCKHIEHMLAKLGRNKATRAALALGFRPPYSEICLRYDGQRRVVLRSGGESPRGFASLCGQFFDAGHAMRPQAFAEFPRFLESAAKLGHEVRCHDDALAFIARVRDRDASRQRVERALGRNPDALLKRLVNASLYSYQREGAIFAATAGRCLIADDMGLGKTIQAITATELLVHAAGIARVLIVCPTSLKHQWKQEIHRFTGKDAQVIEGGLLRRAQQYTAEGLYKIVNYNVIHRDLDAIRRWQPDLVILDEAQRIKNWNTRTAKTVKQLDSPYAIVLTGTPLENRLQELHSIVEFVDRDRLGPAFRFLASHQITDNDGRVVGYRDLAAVGRALSAVLLRRTKSQVLKQLPARLEKRLFIPMTPQQWKIHQENGDTVANIVRRWKQKGFLTEEEKTQLMIALQNMRMACDSTYLFDQQTDHGGKVDELMTTLDELLAEPDAKVVIFSQWTKMLELAIKKLPARRWGHVFFHGQTSGSKRNELVTQFRTDPRCRLFFSTDAGGVGLNLQHASAVINLDLPWNPAVLEQRIGRVHRLGQRRPVHVVNLVAKGTIEEGMLGVLQFKKSLFAGVLDGGADQVFLGGTRLNAFMKSVESVTGQTTPPPVDQAPSQEDLAAKISDTQQEVDVDEVESDSEQSADAAVQTAAPIEDSADKSPKSDGNEVRISEKRRPGVPAQQQAWADVAQAGLSLLQKLQSAMATSNGSSPDEAGAPALIDRDTTTGQNYLRLPLPDPQTLDQVIRTLASLLQTPAG